MLNNNIVCGFPDNYLTDTYTRYCYKTCYPLHCQDTQNVTLMYSLKTFQQ